MRTCANCDTEIGSFESIKCSVCKEWFCEECIYQCENCEKNICEECAVQSSLRAPLLCPKCAKKKK